MILEVAGCPWDTRPVGRTSPPDALSRVAVFGDNETAANPAPAAETAAAAAELRKHRGQTTTGQTWRINQ